MSNVYVTKVTAFTCSHLMKRTGVLPGGRGVETFEAPEHRSLPGCNFHSIPIHFGLDVRWRAIGVH